jgi:3-dehydroquinate synthase
MVEITVSASKTYSVQVGPNLLCQLGTKTAALVSGRASVIVSDSNVWPIYGEKAVISMEKAGFQVSSFVISAGEASKNGENYLRLLTFLAEHQIARSDCLIALGGGVVGDLTGFVAATYLRGIPYVQVPTSLLAMVDSSVGGKTAIDLPAGKNLVGAFYQPSLVLCDTETLKTLPENRFIEGCAEIVKYGILYDPALFAHLEEKGMDFDRTNIIGKCIEWKKQAVVQDEFDTGCRRMLNLGHTLGHSIEKASDYRISHGAAVAIGMSIMAKYAVAQGLCSSEDCDRMIDLLKKFDLPTHTDLSSDVLVQHALSDKKRSGDKISLVLPATIGCCKLIEMPVTELENCVKEGV